MLGKQNTQVNFIGEIMLKQGNTYYPLCKTHDVLLKPMVERHTRAKWLIHSTKHHKDNFRCLNHDDGCSILCTHRMAFPRPIDPHSHPLHHILCCWECTCAEDIGTHQNDNVLLKSLLIKCHHKTKSISFRHITTCGLGKMKMD